MHNLLREPANLKQTPSISPHRIVEKRTLFLFDSPLLLVYDAGMLKSTLIALLAGFGVALAAPLKFYIVPGTGVSPWSNPLVMPDIAALAAAEEAADKAPERYKQGLASYRDILETKLTWLRMLEPLVRDEKGHFLHKLDLFEAAREKRKLVEKLYNAGATGELDLREAQLVDDWLRARSLVSRDWDVCQSKLQSAEARAIQVEKLVHQGYTQGLNDRADCLLAAAAVAEVQLAQYWKKSAPPQEALERAEKVYEELSRLMAARKLNSLEEEDAAASAEEALRMFRSEVNKPATAADLQAERAMLQAMSPVIEALQVRGKVKPHVLHFHKRDLERNAERLQKALNEN